MKRYRIENGVPVAPPATGVSADGRQISGFATLVESDGAFAAAHGYYPVEEAPPPPKGARVHHVDYRFAGDRWVRTVVCETK